MDQLLNKYAMEDIHLFLLLGLLHMRGYSLDLHHLLYKEFFFLNFHQIFFKGYQWFFPSMIDLLYFPNQ